MKTALLILVSTLMTAVNAFAGISRNSGNEGGGGGGIGSTDVLPYLNQAALETVIARHAQRIHNSGRSFQSAVASANSALTNQVLNPLILSSAHAMGTLLSGRPTRLGNRNVQSVRFEFQAELCNGETAFTRPPTIQNGREYWTICLSSFDLSRSTSQDFERQVLIPLLGHEACHIILYQQGLNPSEEERMCNRTQAFIQTALVLSELKAQVDSVLTQIEAIDAADRDFDARERATSDDDEQRKIYRDRVAMGQRIDSETVALARSLMALSGTGSIFGQTLSFDGISASGRRILVEGFRCAVIVQNNGKQESARQPAGLAVTTIPERYRLVELGGILMRLTTCNYGAVPGGSSPDDINELIDWDHSYRIALTIISNHLDRIVATSANR